MGHRDYGRILYSHDEAIIAADGAISLTDINGAVFTPTLGGAPFVALHLTGRIVGGADGAVTDSGDTLAVVWLASLGQLEELLSAVLRATSGAAGPGAAYALLTRAWEGLDRTPRV